MFANNWKENISNVCQSVLLNSVHQHSRDKEKNGALAWRPWRDTKPTRIQHDQIKLMTKTRLFASAERPWARGRYILSVIYLKRREKKERKQWYSP